jgi:hypothetical protein
MVKSEKMERSTGEARVTATKNGQQLKDLTKGNNKEESVHRE